MASAPAVRHTGRADRRMFATSDDSTMLKQIQGTHAPDGRDVDVRPILDIIEDVFRRATPTIHVCFFLYSSFFSTIVLSIKE